MIARALRDAGLELEAVGLEDGDLDRRFGYLEGFSMLTTHKQDVPYFNDSQQKRISHRKVKSKRKAQKIARRKNRR